MTEINFFDPMSEPAEGITYSIIAARYKNKWIFVRHQDRETWEIAGGHIEAGETSLEAAGRELTEETGAVRFELVCIATYSVSAGGKTGYGRLYLANVSEIGDVPDKYEIAEIVFLNDLPGNLTYPDIQPSLFNKANQYLKGQNSDQADQKQ